MNFLTRLVTCSDDILKAGIANNGRISATAEHWYQISGGHAWTDATMQRKMTASQTKTDTH